VGSRVRGSGRVARRRAGPPVCRTCTLDAARGVQDLHRQPLVTTRGRDRPSLSALGARSWAPFTNKHRDEFRALWGGFPPREELSGPGVEGMLTAWLPGGMMSGFWCRPGPIAATSRTRRILTRTHPH
jgi:hypothetical protein